MEWFLTRQCVKWTVLMGTQLKKTFGNGIWIFPSTVTVSSTNNLSNKNYLSNYSSNKNQCSYLNSHLQWSTAQRANYRTYIGIELMSNEMGRTKCCPTKRLSSKNFSRNLVTKKSSALIVQTRKRKCLTTTLQLPMQNLRPRVSTT